MNVHMLPRRTLSASAFERFLRDHDARSLLAAAASARDPLARGANWPELHRICDVVVDGQGWRVCRLVDSVTGDRSLFLDPTDTPSGDPGVPYSLQGQALLKWVRAESASPSKEMPPGGEA
jgi:hypothetical protein